MAADLTSRESFKSEVRERAVQTPLEELDPSHWDFFEYGVAPKVLGRLRREAPVHRCERSRNGPYWSITRFEDVRTIELDPRRFSSDGTVSIVDRPFEHVLEPHLARGPRPDELRHQGGRPVAQAARVPRDLVSPVLRHHRREPALAHLIR